MCGNSMCECLHVGACVCLFMYVLVGGSRGNVGHVCMHWCGIKCVCVSVCAPKCVSACKCVSMLVCLFMHAYTA